MTINCVCIGYISINCVEYNKFSRCLCSILSHFKNIFFSLSYDLMTQKVQYIWLWCFQSFILFHKREQHLLDICYKKVLIFNFFTHLFTDWIPKSPIPIFFSGAIALTGALCFPAYFRIRSKSRILLSKCLYILTLHM